MTADEIDALTIADVRAIADRAHEALAKLREVQSLLGGAMGATPAAQGPVAVPVALPTRVRTPMTEAEKADLRAQREALVARNRDELPEDIARLEGVA